MWGSPVPELINVLSRRSETLAVGESCTGGGILAALTSVPGSSNAVWGGFVVYADNAKISQLDVPPQLLESQGAVSSGVVKAMAWGAKVRSGADWSVAVTGIAGPDGGTPEKPVGTVWIGWCDPAMRITARSFHFSGDRDQVRHRVTQEALDGLMVLLDRSMGLSL